MATSPLKSKLLISCLKHWTTQKLISTSMGTTRLMSHLNGSTSPTFKLQFTRYTTKIVSLRAILMLLSSSLTNWKSVHTNASMNGRLIQTQQAMLGVIFSTLLEIDTILETKNWMVIQLKSANLRKMDGRSQFR
ncbi:hypothetical protein L596_030931 [Steinernema carpocapsae]|uniref:Uncharacterized protein n=1 Tax=Steinernema carpocapsae TaxID=34508 RepID=A0A4V5ZZS4_STECR|nr:hypothetical protein L596_030931 [Steinernema carpocapsae]